VGFDLLDVFVVHETAAPDVLFPPARSRPDSFRA